MIGKVTLAWGKLMVMAMGEINGSLPQGLWLSQLRLAGKKLGSGPCLTLIIEYGTNFLSLIYFDIH